MSYDDHLLCQKKLWRYWESSRLTHNIDDGLIDQVKQGGHIYFYSFTIKEEQVEVAIELQKTALKGSRELGPVIGHEANCPGLHAVWSFS